MYNDSDASKHFDPYEDLDEPYEKEELEEFEEWSSFLDTDEGD